MAEAIVEHSLKGRFWRNLGERTGTWGNRAWMGSWKRLSLMVGSHLDLA
jgi:hypothetical protein